MTVHRFHVLGIPHTASNAAHIACAYTQKVVKLCAMLRRLGHHVIHYGNELSEVTCSEHVTVTTGDELAAQYGDRWRTEFYSHELDDPVYRKFFEASIAAIAERKQKHDFLLCMWGAGHRPVADAHKEMILVEPGIGYARGHFAPFKVFESYAILHAYCGLGRVESAENLEWYSVVIPNYFDLADFEYRRRKQNYLLFLGRVGYGKGLHIAIEVARAAGLKLIIAGPGKFDTIAPMLKVGADVEYVGVADRDQRRVLLANARALIAPSTFIEPFGGVQIEALLSGTPTITSDWGAFAENNLHGITGYRCRTLEQFVWAARNIHKILPDVCRCWATQNFSMQRIAPMYQEFFDTAMNVYTGAGWYAPNDKRTDLNWLTRIYPHARGSLKARRNA